MTLSTPFKGYCQEFNYVDMEGEGWQRGTFKNEKDEDQFVFRKKKHWLYEEHLMKRSEVLHYVDKENRSKLDDFEVFSSPIFYQPGNEPVCFFLNFQISFIFKSFFLIYL